LIARWRRRGASLAKRATAGRRRRRFHRGLRPAAYERLLPNEPIRADIEGEKAGFFIQGYRNNIRLTGEQQNPQKYLKPSASQQIEHENLLPGADLAL
jgi:hypothetical protein